MSEGHDVKSRNGGERACSEGSARASRAPDGALAVRSGGAGSSFPAAFILHTPRAWAPEAAREARALPGNPPFSCVVHCFPPIPHSCVSPGGYERVEKLPDQVVETGFTQTLLAIGLDAVTSLTDIRTISRN